MCGRFVGFRNLDEINNNAFGLYQLTRGTVAIHKELNINK